MTMRNHNVDNIEAALVVFFDAYRRSRSNLGSDTRLAQLSLAEFAVLRAVSDVGDQGVSRVARAAGIAQPPATRALDRLERKGLVHRLSHPTDRRMTNTAVTEAGLLLLSHHRTRLRTAASLIAEMLGPVGSSQAPAVLEAVARALDQASL